MKDERLVLKFAGCHADPPAEQFRDYVDLEVRDESAGASRFVLPLWTDPHFGLVTD
jgi:hypothetical protein